MGNTTATERRRGGFSLIELVIVVVIIGIIAAIAVPKLSRGAAGASDSALSGDLKVIRTSLDMYATEHGGAYPAAAKMPTALTSYTDDQGNVSPDGTKTAPYVYGPYLRAVPPVPVGTYKGQATFGSAAGSGVGWVYDPTKGSVSVSAAATDVDAKGTAYTSY